MAKINRLLIFGLVLRLLLLVVVNSHPDVGNHLDWGNRFWLYEAPSFYTASTWSVSAPNQPFNTIYLFAIIAGLKNILFSITLFLNKNISIFPSSLVWILETNLHVWLVKLPSILSDIGLSWLIYQIVSRYQPKLALIASSLFLFNPVVIYNSTFWGQTDSLINFFSLFGLWLAYNKKYFWGAFFFFLSFTFKMSLLIYLPLYLILLFKQKPNIISLLTNHLIVLAIFFVLTLPFSIGKNILNWPISLYLHTVLGSQGNMLSGNAYNLWFLPYGADIVRQSTPTQIITGSLLFLGFLIPLVIKYYFSKNTLNNLILVCFLTSFASFLFLTNMHERYLYPIFPLLPLLYSFNQHIFSIPKIITLSLLHWLNLYQLWYYPSISPLKIFLESNSYLPGRIFTLILFLFYAYFLINYYQSDQKK
ncbi:hypothetical protein KBC75_04240 [Candidatus Shapirobacteria bacterium]|nr:hypothetical protein [Candidatus Shapirobacteria bacterium]